MKTKEKKQALHLIILYGAALAFLLTGCTDRNPQAPGGSMQQTDTTYTQQSVLAGYDYDPVRALQIVDSAVIVGNLSPVRGDLARATVYSKTLAGAGLDSFLQKRDMGRLPFREGVRFDSARSVGERLLQNDSLIHNPGLRQDVLEILLYTARHQQDTARWLERSQQLIETCREQGAETEALRTGAEMGAALWYMGEKEKGMAMMDSVTDALSEGLRAKSEDFGFNELDAYIIAAKRKIGVLNAMGRFVETIPLSRRIIELLDDYDREVTGLPPYLFIINNKTKSKDEKEHDDHRCHGSTRNHYDDQLRHHQQWRCPHREGPHRTEGGRGQVDHHPRPLVVEG